MKKDNRPQEMPLVALDLGSSSLKAMAAYSLPEEDGRIHILGVEQSHKFDCISRGRITNTTSAGYLISEVLKLLANRIGQTRPFSSAFVAIGGKSMSTASIPARRQLAFKPVIDASLINGMMEECKMKFQNKYNDYDLFYVRPAYFQIDNVLYGSELPLGTRGENVKGLFTSFYGDNQMLPEVKYSFDRSTAELESVFPRPMALVEALASEEDEQLGLAILDFGYDTTTVSVYKNGEFLRSKTIALGGKHITSDIRQMHISQANAEALKVRYGIASEQFLKKNPTLVIPSTVAGEEPVRLPLALLTEIVNSRLDEILQEPPKILQQYEDTISIVYVTGGASRLNYLVEYLRVLIKIPVEYGSHADWLDDDTEDEFCAPEYSALVGSLLLARKYRKKHQPPVEKKTMGEKITTRLLDLFTDQQ